MGARWRWSALLLVALVAACGSAQSAPAGDSLPQRTIPTRQGPPGAVLTQRGDTTRLAWYATESRLDAATVAGHFGKRLSLPVDGKIYAQPLYFPDRGRDIVVAATEHGTVYAFDAATGAAVWQTSVLQPGARPFDAAKDRVAQDRLCDSITPEVSVTGTPVIDWATRTLYVLALDVESGRMTYRLHALDLATGKRKGTSAVVAATVGGTGLDAVNGQVSFQAKDEQQRMGLALVDGIVYAGFGSWCGLAPYHGWLFGFRADNLDQAVTYNTSPDDYAGGLWESQAGVTADEHGDLLLVTGNGSFNLDTGGRDAGDTVLRLRRQGETMRVVDTFTPYDQQCRARHDQDLGSGSPLVVPGRGELVLSSKTGSVYVLDRDHLGGYTPLADACQHHDRTDVDKTRQELTVNTVDGGMWGTWGYWHGPDGEYVYGSGAGSKLTQWRLGADGRLQPTPVAQAPEAFAFPGAVPVVSSDGSKAGTGIVWTVDGKAGATLRAFDASDIGHELWNSDRDQARDGLDDTGGFNHFVAATVAAGEVFVGDQSHLEIYGTL
jgi:outer membrane protein assembly factor BamB